MGAQVDTDNVCIVHGDCLETLRGFADGTVDSVVTDPPYELGFMGKKWDGSGIAFSVELWREVLRVLKPGGHLLAFGGTRTYHRMTCAIEDAGFEIRDCLTWNYKTGFPKSRDVSKAIDAAAAGAEREVVGSKLGRPGCSMTPNASANVAFGTTINNGPGKCEVTAPATEAAKQWDGWGTALKPSLEPIVLARKPLEGTVAANVLKWGTGGLNVDGCRIAMQDGETLTAPKSNPANRKGGIVPIGKGRTAEEMQAAQAASIQRTKGLGRWPANSLFEDPPADIAPYFFCAKPSRRERDLGCDALPARTGGEATDREDGSAGVDNPRAGAGRTGGAKNHHPTVKPVELMRYLVRLVTPPGGIVLDPFLGSGTTGIAALREGFRVIGIDQSEEYVQIAKARIAAAGAAR